MMANDAIWYDAVRNLYARHTTQQSIYDNLEYDM